MDPFHYYHHSCSHDPESGDAAHNTNGSAAESINAGNARVRRTVSYLGPESAVPYLACRTVFTNLVQKAKLSTGFSDVASLRLSELGSQLMPCKCDQCITGRESKDPGFESVEKVIRGQSGPNSVWGRAAVKREKTRRTSITSRVDADCEARRLNVNIVSSATLRGTERSPAQNSVCNEAALQSPSASDDNQQTQFTQAVGRKHVPVSVVAGASSGSACGRLSNVVSSESDSPNKANVESLRELQTALPYQIFEVLPAPADSIF